MTSLLSRVKQWRLRWKIAPVVLILGFVVFCLIAKRPPLEIELTQVLQEGDWFRIECMVTNVSSYEHEFREYTESRTLDLMLLYTDEFPKWDDNWKVLYPPSVNFPDFPWNPETVTVTLSPGEKRRMVGYLHSEYGKNRFVPTTFYHGGNSPHEKLSQWMTETESDLKFGWQLFRMAERAIYYCFFPGRIRGEEFIPADKVSGRLGKSIETRVDELLDQKLTPRLEFLRTNNAYLNLQKFSKLSREEFEWMKEKSEGRWERELEWRLVIGGWLSASDEEQEEAKRVGREWLIDPPLERPDEYMKKWGADKSILEEVQKLAKCIQRREEEKQENELRKHFFKLYEEGMLQKLGPRDSWRELVQ